MVYLNRKSLENLVFSRSWHDMSFLEQALKLSRFYKECMAGLQPLPRSDTFFTFLKTKISQNIQHVTLILHSLPRVACYLLIYLGVCLCQLLVV